VGLTAARMSLLWRFSADNRFTMNRRLNILGSIIGKISRKEEYTYQLIAVDRDEARRILCGLDFHASH